MITNSSPSPSSSTPAWLWAWLWEWGGDTLRVLVMTGSSAGPDTCESASARTACTWAGWAATQAASSSSFATRKWAGQPHRPCMRRTRWTFAGEGIERGRGGRRGAGGGVARKVEMKNETQRDLALSHLPTRGQCPSPASGHRRSQIKKSSTSFPCILQFAFN